MDDTTRGHWAECVHSTLQELLTEKQYRRLYMVKGEVLTGREAAKAENVWVNAVQKSVAQAMKKLAPEKVVATHWDRTPRPRPCPRNGRLLLLWLFPPGAAYEAEDTDQVAAIFGDAEQVAAIFGDDPRQVAEEAELSHVWGLEPGEDTDDWPAPTDDWLAPRPGEETDDAPRRKARWDGAHIIRADRPNRAPRWESEQCAPPIDPLEAYADGWMAHGDGENEQTNPHRTGDTELRSAWARGWQEAAEAARELATEAERVVTVPLSERVPHAIQAEHRSGRPHVRDSTDVPARRVS